MSKIYENATITLSTTGFRDSQQGFFSATNEQFISRRRTFTNSNHEQYEIHCHELLPQLKAPLYARGWVFQERMLSRRIVHFMENEVWWECRQSFRCECGSPDHNEDVFKTGDSLTAKTREISTLQGTEISWEDMVETYSLKLLTYPSDVFPAIQALAKLFPPRMCRYLAGHWESTLIMSLGWWASSDSLSTPDKRKEWRAPSWSWAAFQGGVYWPIKNGSSTATCATLLRALTTPMGDDPMGQLSDGFIIIRGKVLAGERQKPQGRSHRLILEGQRVDAFKDWTVKWDNLCHEEIGKPVFAVKVCEHDDSYTVSQSWIILEGLEGTDGEYVRVGLLLVEIHLRIGLHKREWDVITDKAVEMDLKIV